MPSWNLQNISPPPSPLLQEAIGLDLSKPKPQPIPEDYQFEQSIPDTPMTRRFGHLRGAKVKTVSETVADFYKIVSRASRQVLRLPLFRKSTYYTIPFHTADVSVFEGMMVQ